MIATCFALSVAAVDPVSLAELLDRAERRNETVGINEVRIAQSRARVRRAVAELLPRWSVAGTYTRRAIDNVVNGSVLSANDALFGEMQVGFQVFEAASIPPISAAEGERDAEIAASQERLRQLRFDVADAFFTVLVTEGAKEAAEERLSLSRKTLDDVQQRFTAGLASANDRSRSQLEVASARLALTQAENAERQARLLLGFTVGDSVQGPLKPPSAAEATPVVSVEAALERRPDLQSLRSSIEAAERLALEPWLRLIPSVDALGRFTATNETGFRGNTFNWTLALTATWVLYEGGVRYADAAENAARVQELQLTADRLERQVRLEVEQARSDLIAAEAAVAQSQEQKRIAELNFSEVQDRFRNGLATALEQADAAVERFDAQLNLEVTRFSLRQARLALDRAAGRVRPLDAGAPTDSSL